MPKIISLQILWRKKVKKGGRKRNKCLALGTKLQRNKGWLKTQSCTWIYCWIILFIYLQLMSSLASAQWTATAPPLGRKPWQSDPRSHSLTRTVLHLWEKTTRNTIQPIGSLLQPEMNALAINPCCRVDKLIACIAISSPASNIKEPSVRVILQQIGIVSKYKASRTVNLDKKMRKIYFEWLQDPLSASVY